MHYNWNWGIFWEQSPDGIPYIDTLLIGLKWTIATAVLAWIMALILGTVIGTIRTTQKPWAVKIANGYVELFRNIPLLVQMFLWYFVMPELVPAALGDWLKSLPQASFVTAFLALGFFTSSRVAVQVSTGINALPRGQRMAGAALGLTPVQTYRYVLLPMAFRIIIPALTNEFAAIIKNSSVALTIGLVELTAATYSMREFTFQTFESLTGATVIYIIISVIALMLARFLERVTAVPGYITTGSSSSGGH
ncbi:MULTISPECIES: amino acid ABC transporter permease [unclassified Herbaspirillum]|jgi:glutamate/aspartate transport system permease protein|uniref:amino acid ABC transporter permease n=1 Tax=unclassified Herbaspirillum TaxID=2624150 RepID=UPI000E2EC644|nr:MULTISPECIES: amino acid ABC transporter permease [unclassified Herbaspirillum]RFB69414.1 amino acid ABC transporter permease [Herbaspirillum sp. 3R-3a1]TFI07533.1 amino acid ABC transporter permease [Herbaspirillum sp. 3R11]TFI12306.1 amino acid ABC transporter permease [Herbaspirillum sp. 3R-11]TFI29354.1 amino acid ABC transporter permease [Herbaspirillum sp. 3C11]